MVNIKSLGCRVLRHVHTARSAYEGILSDAQPWLVEKRTAFGVADSLSELGFDYSDSSLIVAAAWSHGSITGKEYQDIMQELGYLYRTRGA